MLSALKNKKRNALNATNTKNFYENYPSIQMPPIPIPMLSENEHKLNKVVSVGRIPIKINSVSNLSSSDRSSSKDSEKTTRV